MWKKPTKKIINNGESESCKRNDEDYAKAAAWAWYLRGAGAGIQSKPVEEDSDAESINPLIKRGNKRRPSRFKLEALGLLNNNILENSFTTLDAFTGVQSDSAKGFRDYLDLFSLECRKDICGSSLFDSYDLVALSKQLENLVWRKITEPSVFCEKSAPKNSWMDLGISPDVCNNNYKKNQHNHHRRLYDLARKFQEIVKAKKDHHTRHRRLRDS